MKHDSKDVEVVAAEILRYLQSHPDAADSLDGVVTWWLQRQHYQVQVELVQRALDHLVARNQVARQANPGGRFTYASTSRRDQCDDEDNRSAHHVIRSPSNQRG